MQKTKITLEVPERIAFLVQNYVQRNAFGDANNIFHNYLNAHGVENPDSYTKEISIGIEHPDDEPIKIQDFLRNENKKVRDWLYQKRLWSYMDMVLDEHLFSIDCLDEVNVDPPQIVLDFIQSVKATDCSYFRFVNS